MRIRKKWQSLSGDEKLLIKALSIGSAVWIAMSFLTYKTAFNFFMYLFSLSETSPAASAAPVVTVPAR